MTKCELNKQTLKISLSVKQNVGLLIALSYVVVN